ncbi:MAG: hypothetical protein GXO96_04375 [Nitrospirae bacterium]|nr:hypothetical protein [Candidatus Manganitrophaceae bacterium]
METLSIAFEERLQEIVSYLEFLGGIENEAMSGPPRLGQNGALITTQQQRILYSGVFLQLYNLVEATVVRCLDSITEVALVQNSRSPSDLTEDLRREWVRVIARTHTDLNHNNRLKSALDLCQHFVESLPVEGFKVEKGGGGNWDDSAIEEITSRLGLLLKVSPEVSSQVKRPLKDDLGALALIKRFRNLLAHGSISFVECGGNWTVGDLRDLTTRTGDYLREVVNAFDAYIARHEYLIPSKRPAKV